MNTPHEVIEQTYQTAQKKYTTPWHKIFLLGLLAGAYISVGGLLATMTAGGFGGWAVTNPGLSKLMGGIVFPIGLIFVVLVGAELFTGNTATLMPAMMRRQVSPVYVLKNWLIVFCANVLGAVLFSYFLAYQSGILKSEVYTTYITSVAVSKCSLSWGEVFWRGVGANWLVCLAVWLGLSSRSMLGRLVGLWWPIMAFVTIGFEHSIANVYFVPTGIFYGASVSWSDFWWDNLFPTTLGNIMGGALFVGTIYGYLYGYKKGQG